MTWFKVDDKAHDHPKFRRPSLAAIGLWTMAGSWSGDNRTDGFIPATIPRRWSATRKHVEELVAAGLWEPAEVDGEPGWRYHDWPDHQPEKEDTADALGRARWARKNALSKNRRTCDAVVARDGGLCRYCGVDVNFRDRKGPRGGTYDHVDPRILDAPGFYKANAMANVVVACRRCNGRKRDRTPEEAGMPLLPIGTTAAAVAATRGAGSDSGSDSGSHSRSHSDQAPPREAGRSQVGVGSDLTLDGSDLAPDGPGQVGPGSGLNGNGSGRRGSDSGLAEPVHVGEPAGGGGA